MRLYSAPLSKYYIQLMNRGKDKNQELEGSLDTKIFRTELAYLLLLTASRSASLESSREDGSR
jgi:hypothetical protein